MPSTQPRSISPVSPSCWIPFHLLQISFLHMEDSVQFQPLIFMSMAFITRGR